MSFIGIFSLLVVEYFAWLESSSLGLWDKCSTTLLPSIDKNISKLLVNFSLPVPAEAACQEPLTLGLWGKCSVSVLPLLDKKFSTFYNFLSTCASRGGWTGTLDLGIVKQEFYHSAATDWQNSLIFLQFSLYLCQHRQLDWYTWPCDYERSVLPLCYHLLTKKF
jgi:hypothetical protein